MAFSWRNLGKFLSGLHYAQDLRRGWRGVESLEARTLLSTLPFPTDLVRGDLIDQVTGADDALKARTGSDSSPLIVNNPALPNQQAIIYQRNGGTAATLVAATDLAITPEISISKDGGAHWTILSGLINKATLTLDPTTRTLKADGTYKYVAFSQAAYGSAAFDRAGNLYVAFVESNADYTCGAVVFERFDAATLNALVGNTNQVVTTAVAPAVKQLLKTWQYSGSDKIDIYQTTLAVDNNLPTFTDPDSGLTLTDPTSGSVFVAWAARSWMPPDPDTGISGIGSRIELVQSQDQGVGFSLPTKMDTLSATDKGLNYQPRLTIAQGTLDGRIAPGQLSVVWDNHTVLDVDNGSGTTVKGDQVEFVSVSPTGSGAKFPAAAGSSINDATKGALSASRSLTVDATDTTLLTANFITDPAGLPDLITSSFDGTTSTILVYKQSSSRSFDTVPLTVLSGVNGQILKIVGGDFDGDGKVDLAYITDSASSVFVVRGNGVGGIFAAPVALSVGSNPLDLVTGDFNVDSKVDLAVAASSSSRVDVLLNTGSSGTISFNNGSSISMLSSNSPRRIVAGDVNGDGVSDLVVATNDGVQVLFGLTDGTTKKADGTFSSAVSAGGSGGQADFLILSDVNSDSRLDIVLGSRSSRQVTVMLNATATGSFVIQSLNSTLGTSGTLTSLAVADFDGDGKKDLAVTFNGGDVVDLIVGTGDGIYTTITTPTRTGNTDYTYKLNRPLPAQAFNPVLSVSGAIDGDIATDLLVLDPTQGVVDLLWGSPGLDAREKTDIPIVVSGLDPLNLNQLQLDLQVQAVNLGELSFSLVAPNGVETVLIYNAINADGTTNTGKGLSGANLGGVGSVAQLAWTGTYLTDGSSRNIRADSAPYIGYFTPETGTMIAVLNAAKTANVVNGTWSLRVWDYRATDRYDPITNPQPAVLSAALEFGRSNIVTVDRVLLTTVQGAAPDASGLATTYPTASAASPVFGVGPSITIAQDNTLGSHSPYQGRLYMSFTDRRGRSALSGGPNPAYNTDVYLYYSDNGGRSWTAKPAITYYTPPLDPDAPSTGVTSELEASKRGVVNDDNYRDGFSEGNRTQFQPAVSVDPLTGVVAVSFYDARWDAGNSRVARTLAISCDGGLTFAPQNYLNYQLTATDAITGQTVDLGPLVDNATPKVGYGADNAKFGWGENAGGLLLYGGALTAVWSGNLDGDALGVRQFDVLKTTAHVAVGPRVIESSGQIIDATTTASPLPTVAIANGSKALNTLVISFDDAAGATDLVANFATELTISLKDLTGTLHSLKILSATASGSDVTVIFDPNQNANSTPYTGPVTGTYLYSLNSTFSGIYNLGAEPTQIPTMTMADGTLVPAGFILVFDRAVDARTFTADQVKVLFNPANGSAATNMLVQGIFPLKSVKTQDAGFNVAGYRKFLVTFNPNLKADGSASGLTSWAGNYTYSVAAGLSDAMYHVSGTQILANGMDQNANGTGGQIADSFSGFDPTNKLTLPLLVPGPQIVATQIVQSTGTLAATQITSVDKAVIALQITFDRDMTLAGLIDDAAAAAADINYTNPAVLRMMGPAGQIKGPFHITQVSTTGPTSLKVFKITFGAAQSYSGTYVLNLASWIKSAAGDALDTNENAGLYLLRGSAASSSASVTYMIPNTAMPMDVAPGTSADSLLTITDSYALADLKVKLNLSAINDPDVEVTLVKGSLSVVLFSGIGNYGSRTDFNTTVLDDSAPIGIADGAAPFNGTFRPASPLTPLKGQGDGTWILRVTNHSKINKITLNSWGLILSKAVSNTGLGEAVEDRATLSFTVANLDPNNPLSTGSWTSVGSATGGRPGGTAFDPSDPSGNTVYIGGASGGIWKTTNFLTTNPAGPVWIPLTDFGPTTSLNIGGLAVLGRNNDPNQSIIFASTGEGDTGTPGVGFLRSLDGGMTWSLLDSTVNVDSAGNPLPFDSTLRDHHFVGTSSFKVALDPKLTTTGEVVVYGALTGTNGGLYRSFDSGKTWKLLKGGDCTDISLDLLSAYPSTLDTSAFTSSPTGNVQRIYAAFRGDGVYVSPNQGESMILMPGGAGIVQLQEAESFTNVGTPLPITASTNTPNGAKARIVMAKPALTGNIANDRLYEGWLYVLVINANDSIDGLYQTKDNGANWTQVRIPARTVTDTTQTTGTNALFSNDLTLADYDVTKGQGNYDVTITIDPANPNVVYLGGTMDYSPSGLIRVDTTGVSDAHALVLRATAHDGGALYINSTDGVTLKGWGNSDNIQGSGVIPINNPTGLLGGDFRSYLNLLPGSAPYLTNGLTGTLFVSNTAKITNTGFGATYLDFQGVAGTDMHRSDTMIDPITGLARLMFGYDQGISTVLDIRGSAANFDSRVSVDRNGNLQTAQFYYGSAQPDMTAARAAQAIFYGSSQDNGLIVAPVDPTTGSNVMTTGNPAWWTTGGDAYGTAVDMTGSGIALQYRDPRNTKNAFFEVWDNSATPAVQSRINGLPAANGPHAYSDQYAVNPVNPNQITIGRSNGELYATEDMGRQWSLIGNPTLAGMDGSMAYATAYGAPQLTVGDRSNLSHLIYAGTQGGHLYVTFNAGGDNASEWRNISTGLDGSAVMQIVTNPTRGSYEVYAVTAGGVFWMKDSSAAGATWTKITGNLRQIQYGPFNTASMADTQARSLVSIQADWRYQIPDTLGQALGGTHPVLYVAANSGIYRSLDKGQTWTLFPSEAVDGATIDGGGLPNAQFTSLQLATGAISTTTGMPQGNRNDMNLLYASTYGRSSFAIRLKPLSIPGSVELDASTGSDDLIGNGTVFDKITSQATPTINGVSEVTGFGSQTTITIYRLNTDGTKGSVVGIGLTDATGKFSIKIAAPALTGGLVRLGVQASNIYGFLTPVLGNLVEFDYVYQPTSTSTGSVVTGIQKNEEIFAVGLTTGATVRVFDANSHKQLWEFLPFGLSATTGVSLAIADVNGDGFQDVICGSGLGRAQVAIFSGLDGKSLLTLAPADFAPTSGVNVAVGLNLDKWGHQDSVYLAMSQVDNSTAGGKVKLVEINANLSQQEIITFNPFGSSWKDGINVALGDVDHVARSNGIYYADLVVSKGAVSTLANVPTGNLSDPTFGSLVAIYYAEDLKVGKTTAPKYLYPFNRYYTGNVSIAVGDINGDGYADILTGSGAGLAPEVAVYNALTATPMWRFNAFDVSFTGGVCVGTVKATHNGIAQILVGMGGISNDLFSPSGATFGKTSEPRVRVYSSLDLAMLQDFLAYPQISTYPGTIIS